MTGSEFYCCNREISLSVDAEKFEKYCRDAKACASDREKIEKYKKAFVLYKGEYMNGYNDVYWLDSMTTFYRSMYLSAIRECTALLEKYGRYEEVEQVIRQALDNESLDEELHACFVRSLSMQGKQKLAMEQYEKSVKMLRKTFGVTKLESMQREYRRLTDRAKAGKSDFAVIKSDLLGEKEEGAFLCEYSVFRQIYRLERRRLKRCSASIFLVLITVEAEGEEQIAASALKSLETALLKVLRAGDVIARYSRSQYILMLPSCQYSSLKGITERIDRKFGGAAEEDHGLKVRYSMEEIR